MSTTVRQRPGWTLPRVVLAAATALAIVLLPLGLVCSNVRTVTLDRDFYLSGFQKYGGAARVSLSPAEQAYVADAFIAYFQSSPGTLDVLLARNGGFQPLFNQREVAHMEDVQAIMQLVFRLAAVSLGYVVIYAVVCLLVLRRRFLPVLARVCLGSAAVTLVTLLVFGALALTDFQSLFLQFHELSFGNDLWQLDPARDNLIRLFPEGFWFEALLRILGLTVVQVLALGVAGLLGLRFTRT